jgi:arylsulfatase A-like enzyme
MSQPSTNSRPNILIFMTDDHGQWASRAYGNRELFTPTMDWLGASGARMLNAFTPSPVCSPARASFFTGAIPSRHGIHDWLSEQQKEVHPGLEGQTLLPERLRAAGYHTGLVGKWHCGEDRRTPPGFERWFGYADGQYLHFGAKSYRDQDQVVGIHGHQAAVLTDQAIRFLRERPADRPFFLFVGYVNTHKPHKDQPRRLVEHYRKGNFQDIPADESPAPGYRPNRRVLPNNAEEAREWLAQYYAAVTMIDEQIGRVMDELDNLKLDEQTLIVYTADHGHMNGHHGLECKGNNTVPQNFLEESIRVPLMVRWGAGIAPGQTPAAFVDHCDLFATLLAAGGAAGVLEAESPGRSFLPLLAGVDAPWREAQFCEYGNARMIRTGRYKLICRYPGPNGHFPDELYDLLADPRETVNRIGEPELGSVVEGLRQQLEAYFARHAVPERDGRRIELLVKCNNDEPWRRE